ncbi:MAG: chemotaxis protein CheB, partial [Kiloniellales bacterium]
MLGQRFDRDEALPMYQLLDLLVPLAERHGPLPPRRLPLGAIFVSIFSYARSLVEGNFRNRTYGLRPASSGSPLPSCMWGKYRPLPRSLQAWQMAGVNGYVAGLVESPVEFPRGRPGRVWRLNWWGPRMPRRPRTTSSARSGGPSRSGSGRASTTGPTKQSQKRSGSRSKPVAKSAARGGRRGAGSAAPLLVVGIGASAGGLAAFETFFAHMPADSGMAFVLVQHLDPHHKSLLAELLGRHTAIPVAEAEDRMAVSANRILIIPPDATLTIKAGVLRVLKPAPAREHRRPIDTFFASLAEDQGECAVSVVLSGTGSDGTLGVRAIKGHGGLTLAQGDLGATAMSGMPHSAAATGLVDYILPVEDMPAALVEYRQHLIKVAGKKDADGNRRAAGDHLSAIFAILRAGTGHDFSQYKPNTLMRRIQRRMQVLRTDTISAFVQRLRNEPREVELLFREFVIGVTQFFRNPEAFDALASVLPELLKGKGDADLVRIWVPGCATGEEVYSIAILVRESVERQGIAPRIQIFGTDIDEAAIAVARAGRYRKPMARMSRERAERWFAEEGDDYCPIKEIREMCVFSTHSVIKDPPFSKLDLISCRNLMIYMSADLQGRILRTFHYALRRDGYLCLGQSEGITRSGRLFEAIDKKHRIFRRLDNSSPVLPDSAPAGPPTATRPLPGAPHAVPRIQDLIDHGAHRVMEKHSPAYVVIDRQYEILRFSGGEIGRYLEPSPGRASLNLLGIVRKALRPAVRAAVREAYTADRPVTTETLTIRVDGQVRSLKLIVEPIEQSGVKGLCVVAFRDVGEVSTAADAPAATPNPEVQALEHELQATKVQLQGTIDELETANEELKSANEEYQSVNEELQSSNEELETAKEELQSTNEELETINAELNSKNETLVRLNSDIRNLLESTQIATIFLDGKLRIRAFTPGVTDLLHLRDSDRGRPITDLVPRMTYADLQRDAKKVLRDLSVVEREVQVADDATTFLMRIRPYRTISDVIDGVVITFVDITERMHHEIAAARLAAIVDSSQDAVIGHGFDGVIRSWNAGAERIFGYTADEAVGKPFSILLADNQSDEVPLILDAMRRGETIAHFEVDRLRKDGTRIDVSLSVSPIKDRHGKVIAASTIAREFTERRLAEEQKSLLIAELDHRVRNTLATVTALIAQTARSAESPQAFVEAIQGRVRSLSRVHGLLTQRDWDQADLRELVEAGLTPYRSKARKNIVVTGNDNVVLKPKAILPLAMALHELATNATKYGSLSQPGGSVAVSWGVAI